MLVAKETLEALSEKYRFTIKNTWHDESEIKFWNLEFPNVTRAVLFHNAFCGAMEMEFLYSINSFHEKVVVMVWDE